MEQKCTDDSPHPPISDHVLVLMVQGIFFKLEFPYAHFGTKGTTTDFLFPIVWEGIHQLESLGFKVICVTADGASPNKKFFRMNGKNDLVYKTYNDPKENRPLYFISDPSNLIKTTRIVSFRSKWNSTNDGTYVHNKHTKILYMCMKH